MESIQKLIVIILTWLFSILPTSPTLCFGLDQQINQEFMPFALWWEGFILSELFGIPVVLIVLISGALLFTFYFGFANIRLFFTSISVVRGKYDDLEGPVPLNQHDVKDTIKDESHYGEVNHFQALTTAVSGTVGLGNIAMVAVAISIGGPGATFWMIVAGILGMSTKMVECTLGVKYRSLTSDGEVLGGPMYYLSKGLKDLNKPFLGKILSVLFALLCVGASFGGGNAFQSNQATAQIINRFGMNSPSSGFIIGLIFAIVAGVIIIGGIKRIAKVTEKLVPLMAGIYILAALIILTLNYDQVIPALFEIVQSAFTPKATITGGIAIVIIQGFRRAAFSNEAGAGSAAIAHSAVNTKFPASEGLVAMLEPFIDTVVICTITALVIIIFNMDNVFEYGDVINGEVLINGTERIGGVNLTSMAFDSSIPGFSYVLAIAVILFALSTMISWSYYGLQSWKFLFGQSKGSDLTYKFIFLTFTILGSSVTLDAVIKFSDAMILALVFPNMIGLFFLFPIVKKELQSYLNLIKSQSR